MKIGLLDDDPGFLKDLKDLILSYQNLLNIEFDVEMYESGKKLLQDIECDGVFFDILFLDISMEDLNGITVGQRIRKIMNNHSTEIIYISAYPNYLREIITVQPYGFVDKPIDPKMFFKLFTKCLKKSSYQDTRFGYRFNRDMKFICQKDILYFESDKRQIHLVATNFADTFIEKLDLLEERVDDCFFLRTHKSFLVNLRYVSLCKPNEIVMDNGESIPISRTYRKSVSLKIEAIIEGDLL